MPNTGRIWASLPIPAFVTDADDRISVANPAAEEFMNTSFRSVEGAIIYERLSVDAPLQEAMSRVRGNGSPIFINDVEIMASKGGAVHATIQVAPIVRDPGRLLVLVSPREIAGRLERSHSTDKAAKSAIGMAEMLAHEIKNPLAGITGAAQLLSMNARNGDLELCDLIVAETRRVVKLLEQVEQFGNLRPPTVKPVNLHDLLDRARKSAMVGFASDMVIVEDYDPSLPATLADGDQLLQVFLNLLKNASEAAQRAARAKPSAGAGRAIANVAAVEDEPTIRIRTFYEASLRVRRKSGGSAGLPLQVEIIDNGPGLPPEIAEDIFEPFVSGRENGTGLGLALVSKIIGDHNAWIRVDSRPGRTAFRISLPVAPDVPQFDYYEETA